MGCRVAEKLSDRRRETGDVEGNCEHHGMNPARNLGHDMITSFAFACESNREKVKRLGVFSVTDSCVSYACVKEVDVDARQSVQ